MQALVIAVSFAVLAFVAIIAGTVMGAVAGYIVGYFFHDTLQLLANALHMGSASDWQLGACLGFMGGFFRTSVSKK
jgi:membrane protein YqaA with SNARE-associated domain